MQKTTIKEIARIAGVSMSAVSLVINGRKGVSDETRKKVTEIIETLQYAPNPNSRRLLFKKTNNIAVLFKKSISPLEHVFYSELNRVVLHECEAHGYNLIFTSASVEGDTAVLPSVIRSYDVDGIIIYGDVDMAIFSSLRHFDIPYIIVDNHTAMPDALCVSFDYAEAARTAVLYLIGLGHRDIAYIGNGSEPHYNAQTFSGYKKATEAYQTAIPVHWIQFDASDEETACRCMETVLSGEKIPTAVFCAADIYAIGAMKAAKRKGLRIPGDISVIGIDDIILSNYVEPPLTTIRIDKEEMGRATIELLVKKIEKAHAESRILAPNRIAARASTGQAPQP